MGLFIDLKGQRFGRLRVVAPAGRLADGRLAWQCVCDCGLKARVSGQCLRSGLTRSCGCLRGEKAREARFRAKRVEGGA